ncbi:MAG: caspase family protein [Magnetococcales bacterium]|nr:caspase family protein [Magnetococcales bacterium]
MKGKSPAFAGRNAIKIEQKKPLSPAQSKVSVVALPDFVQKRLMDKNIKEEGYYAEALKLVDGNMYYEHWNEKAQREEKQTPTEELLSRYGADSETDIARQLDQLGIDVTPEKIKEFRKNGTLIHYLLEDSKSHRCFIFFRSSTEDDIHVKEEHIAGEHALSGVSCVKKSQNAARDLEWNHLELTSQVFFDNGKRTKDQLLKKSLAKLDKLAELEAERLKRINDTEKPQFNGLPVTLEIDTFGAVTVRGTVSDQSALDMVRINGTAVAVEGNQAQFQLEFPVRPGQKAIHLMAMDEHGLRTDQWLEIDFKGMDMSVFWSDTAAVSSAGNGISMALLIGNSDYAHWGKLVTPSYDIDSLANVLQNSYGYEVLKLIDTSKNELLEILESYLVDKTRDVDNLLIYYAGHGLLYKKRGYWIPVDGLMDDPALWVSNQRITRALRRLPARNVMVISDSCYSGTMIQNKPTKKENTTFEESLSQMWSRTGMAASDAEEVALEPVLSEGEVGNSLFADVLLDVLDGNRGRISASLVYENVSEILEPFPQNPQYGPIGRAGHDLGADFTFTRTE